MRGTRGLSLIELVVAMALFALVAVMGMQTLNGTIRTRDALTFRDGRDRALAVTLALLRTDLDRAAPLLFYPPDGPPQSALYQDPGQAGFGLSVSAVDTAAPAPFQRVEWRLDRATGTLTRATWPGTTPARTGQRSPDRVMLEGVQSLRLRSLWEGEGWIEGIGNGLLGAAAPKATDGDTAFARLANTYTDALPQAIELGLTIDGLGDIRVLEALP